MKPIKPIIIVIICALSCAIANAKDTIQLEIREIIIPKCTQQPAKIDTSSTALLFKEIQKSHPEATMSMLTSVELKNNEIAQKKSGFTVRDLATGEEQLIGTELAASIVSESSSAAEVIINLKQHTLEKFVETKQPDKPTINQPIFSTFEVINKVSIYKGSSSIISIPKTKDGSLRIIVITLATAPESTPPRS